jgi:hypothetical protein
MSVISQFIYRWLYSPCGPWPLFQFLNLYAVGRTPWMGDQPVARPLPAHRTTQTQNESTQTSMPGVGFEPMIPVFARAKTFHVLDRAATVIGPANPCYPKLCSPDQLTRYAPVLDVITFQDVWQQNFCLHCLQTLMSFGKKFGRKYTFWFFFL